MAKKKKNKKNSNPSLIDRLKLKKRIVIINETTFEEQSHFSVTPLNVITLSTFLVFLLIALVYILIAYSPIKYSIPGYPDQAETNRVKELEIQNAKFLDDESHKVNVEQAYYKNLQAILEDQIPEGLHLADSLNNTSDTIDANLNSSISKEDSILRAEIDQREKYQLNYSSPDIKSSNSEALKGVYFFSPLRGTVSNTLHIKDGHFGIDIAAEKDEAVKAVLDGEIVFSDWSPEQGHMLIIQHKQNIISVYKHNSFLLKKTGDFVKAGDAIAIVGSSGTTSTGTHLHFELWYNGVCLDPLKFISF